MFHVKPTWAAAPGCVRTGPRAKPRSFPGTKHRVLPGEAVGSRRAGCCETADGLERPAGRLPGLAEADAPTTC